MINAILGSIVGQALQAVGLGGLLYYIWRLRQRAVPAELEAKVTGLRDEVADLTAFVVSLGEEETKLRGELSQLRKDWHAYQEDVSEGTRLDNEQVRELCKAVDELERRAGIQPKQSALVQKLLGQLGQG